MSPQHFMHYRRNDNVMLDVYEVLSYEFKKNDDEIFSMPMCRVNVLLEVWSKNMKKRYGVKK